MEKKLNELEEKIEKVEAGLIEQEHRPITLIWNYIKRKSKWKEGDKRRDAATKAIIWRLLFSPATFAIASGGLLAIFSIFFMKKQNELINVQNKLFENQNKLINVQNKLFEIQNTRVDQQTQLIEASRRSSQMILLDGVLRDINEELNNTKIISKNLTARIISLSHMIKPYKFYDYQNDSISKLLSPERGQLLYSIVGSDLDRTYLSETLFKEANFQYSDLNGLRLFKKFLHNVDLRYSSLEGTLLHNSILINADLRDSNIKNVAMSNTIMTNVDLRHANLDDVNLNGAVLDLSDLRNTSFKNLNIGTIKSLNKARVHRYDWFTYLQDSLKVDGVEKLIVKYQVDSIYYKEMDVTIPTIVIKHN